jgi:hypothetical protein
VSQRGAYLSLTRLYTGPAGALRPRRADGQQSDQLPPPGNVLVCFAPWDASLGLRIIAHDPGNRLMPTLIADARSIRTLFPGCRLFPPTRALPTGWTGSYITVAIPAQVHFDDWPGQTGTAILSISAQRDRPRGRFIQ